MSGIFLNTSYFGITSSGASSLFGSLSGTGTSPMSSLLSDYASIKNGSYTKLLTSYYNKINSEDSGTASSTKTDKTTNTQLVSERDAAKELKDSASKLLATGNESLFAKKEIKNEDGSVKEDYDVDAIYKAVSDFVKDYNTTVEAMGNSGVNSVLSTGSNMVSFTKAMAKGLADVGITVGLNNKLSIDEESFKGADMSKVKSLFNGTGSFAYSVSTSASSMANSATSQLARLNGGLYTSTGAYGSSYGYSGSLYTSIF